MRIGIDARLYSESGIGRYIRNLLMHLQRLDQKNEYFVFLLRENLDKVSFKKNFQRVKANFPWYGISEQMKFPEILNKYKLDLAHFPHFNVPIFYRGKFIVTIHDLIHQHFQMERATTHGKLIYLIKKMGYSKIFSYGLKESLKIITVSNFVKSQLEKQWRVESNKIVVTPEAVEDKILTVISKISDQKRKQVLEKFGVRKPFIFYVGNAHPHKNVEGLIKTFLSLRKKYQYLQLVLSGPDSYFWRRIKLEFRDENIIYTGFISDEELVALYLSAQFLVFPSFEEGFGIPILEAFACSCPVVSSSSGSLKEVGGKAAVYFDPHSLADMKEKITLVLGNNKLRDDLIKNGLRRVGQFSWSGLAQQTLKLYQEYGKLDG